jgi:hypothetical protein
MRRQGDSGSVPETSAWSDVFGRGIAAPVRAMTRSERRVGAAARL